MQAGLGQRGDGDGWLGHQRGSEWQGPQLDSSRAAVAGAWFPPARRKTLICLESQYTKCKSFGGKKIPHLYSTVARLGPGQSSFFRYGSPPRNTCAQWVQGFRASGRAPSFHPGGGGCKCCSVRGWQASEDTSALRAAAALMATALCTAKHPHPAAHALPACRRPQSERVSTGWHERQAACTPDT